MPENVSINKPIEIKDNSIERVAFDLAMDITSVETSSFSRKEYSERYRKELLRLYDQCLTTTLGGFESVDFEKDDSTD